MKLKKFFSIQRMCVMALFVALQIVLSRYLSYQLSHSTRISLANVPNILAGLWLGPISGGVVALVSDVLGMLLQPSSGVYFPPLTLAPILLVVGAGYFVRWLPGKRKGWAVAAAVLLGEILSALYGSLALTWYYQLFVKQITFWEMLVLRMPWKLVLAVLDTVVCSLLHKCMYERVIRRNIAYEL